MRWTKWAVLVAFGMVGLVVGMPGKASAQYRRQSATFCMPITSTYGSVRSDSGAVGNGGTSVMRLVCPILDDSTLPKYEVTSAIVDVYDGSTAAGVDARACVSYWGAVGGTCGPAAATGSSYTGTYTLSLSPSVWAGYSNDYGYFVINLPASSGSSVSNVHGYELYK